MLTIQEWIALGIVAIGFVIFLYQVFRKHDLAKKEVPESIEEYKNTRNKLTTRKQEKENDNGEGDYELVSYVIPGIAALISLGIIISVGATVLNKVKVAGEINSQSNLSISPGFQAVQTSVSYTPMIIFMIVTGTVILTVIKIFP